MPLRCQQSPVTIGQLLYELRCPDHFANLSPSIVGILRVFLCITLMAEICGDCVLGITGGICPVSRCCKRLLNGPCGGSTNGKCEISKEIDCAWQLVIDRLEALGRLDDYEKIQPIKDWSKDRAGGPRSFKLEDF